MDKLLKRLHDRHEPPGIEATLLRKMPLIWTAATLAPLGLSIVARFWPGGPTGFDAVKQVTTVDIFVVALIATLWTAVLTVSIACVIISLMKGPGFVADAYPLDSSARPAGGDGGRPTGGWRRQSRQ